MNTETITELKKAVIAYKAAGEYGHCPDLSAVSNVRDHFGYELQDVYDALHDHKGRRPDEIANTICDLVEKLEMP